LEPSGFRRGSQHGRRVYFLHNRNRPTKSTSSIPNRQNSHYRFRVPELAWHALRASGTSRAANKTVCPGSTLEAVSGIGLINIAHISPFLAQQGQVALSRMLLRATAPTRRWWFTQRNTSCRRWVMTGNALTEQMFSASPPEADSTADITD
jgi:hypothetical protein